MQRLYSMMKAKIYRNHDFEEIEEAWKQSQSVYNGEFKDGTHRRFPQEMAKKTVINRACRNYSIVQMTPVFYRIILERKKLVNVKKS